MERMVFLVPCSISLSEIHQRDHRNEVVGIGSSSRLQRHRGTVEVVVAEVDEEEVVRVVVVARFSLLFFFGIRTRLQKFSHVLVSVPDQHFGRAGTMQLSLITRQQSEGARNGGTSKF